MQSLPQNHICSESLLSTIVEENLDEKKKIMDEDALPQLLDDVDEKDSLPPLPDDVHEDALPNVLDLTEMHHHFHMIITQFATLAYQDINNKEWFLAKPICLKLGYMDIPNAIRNLIKNPNHKMKFGDLLSVYPIINRVHPHSTLISESGFYALLLQSKKRQAVAFRAWLVDHLLPALRNKYDCCMKFEYDWEEIQPNEKLKQDNIRRNDLIELIELYGRGNANVVFKYEIDATNSSKKLNIIWKDFKQLIIQTKLNGVKSRFKTQQWRPIMKILQSNATNLTVKWR